MKTIYIMKGALSDYVEFPQPKDLENYHTVEVADDFSIIGLEYNPETHSFVSIVEKDESRLVKKMAEINKWRDGQLETGFVEYSGKRYDRDQTARDNLLGVLTLGVMPVPFWTTYDNEDEPATLEDLKAIYALIIQDGGAIHQRQRQMKIEVSALTGQEISDYLVGWPL